MRTSWIFEVRYRNQAAPSKRGIYEIFLTLAGPLLLSIFLYRAGIAQLVERHLAKVTVESSSLFTRSIFFLFPKASHVFQKTRAKVLRLVFRDFVLADVSGILTLRKVINHGNPRWRVSAIVEGKRRQRFFKTKADAQAWGNDIRSLSPCEQFWRSLSNDERRGIMITYHRGGASPEPSLKPMLIESAIDRVLQIKPGA